MKLQRLQGDTLLVWAQLAVKSTYYKGRSPLLSDKSGFICLDYFLFISMMVQYTFFCNSSHQQHKKYIIMQK